MSRRPDASPDVPGQSSGRFWMPLAVLGLGILAIASLVGTDHLWQRSIVEDLEHLKALGEIQSGAAISHLWLEEYVTGDEVDVLDIYEHLDRSQGLVQAMLGNRDSSALSSVTPLRQPSIVATTRSLAADIEKFRKISFERQAGFEQGLPVGIGSAIDVQYDAVFQDLLSRSRALTSTLEARMAHGRDRSRWVFRMILLAWSGIVGLATFGLWNRERRRRQVEIELSKSQQQLLRSQKMDAVGRLAGGLAHDLNNYLAAVRGHCELVGMRRKDDEWLARKMDAAIRVVNRSSALIERLQTFSRRRPLQMEVLNANRVIESLEKVMAPALGEGIRIGTRLAANLWNIKMDPSQIEQVLVNLLLNAQEAMPKGGELTVSTSNLRRDLPGVEEVLIEVTDTGIGIPREIRDSLFEPFVTTKSDDGRRGLGLAIVYGIAEQHEGRVEVESKVGHGTTFRVFLPRCSEAVTMREPEPTALEQDLKGTERVLLVDDNDEFRSATEELLIGLGYKVLTAGEGEEALTAFEAAAETIELVLIDVVMPGMSGPEVVEKMRQIRPVRALFMSAYTDRTTSQHGIDGGEVHFIKKHLSAQELALKVRESLDASATDGFGSA